MLKIIVLLLTLGFFGAAASDAFAGGSILLRGDEVTTAVRP